MLKLKIETLASDDFGVSGIFKRLSDRHDYVMIDSMNRIAGISQRLFETIFESVGFVLAELRSINLTKLIPLLLATIEL